jgi:hypothetical protein
MSVYLLCPAETDAAIAVSIVPKRPDQAVVVHIRRMALNPIQAGAVLDPAAFRVAVTEKAPVVRIAKPLSLNGC